MITIFTSNLSSAGFADLIEHRYELRRRQMANNLRFLSKGLEWDVVMRPRSYLDGLLECRINDFRMDMPCFTIMDDDGRTNRELWVHAKGIVERFNKVRENE